MKLPIIITLIVAPVFSTHPKEKALVVSVGTAPTIVRLEEGSNLFLRGEIGDVKTDITKVHEIMLNRQGLMVEFTSLRSQKDTIWTKKIVFIRSRTTAKSLAPPSDKSKTEIR